MGYPRLSNTHHITSPVNPAPVAAVEPLQPDNTTKEINAPQRPTHTPAIPHDANPTDFAENTANDSTAKHLTLKDHFDSRSQQSGPPAQKCRQPSRQTSRISNRYQYMIVPRSNPPTPQRIRPELNAPNRNTRNVGASGKRNTSRCPFTVYVIDYEETVPRFLSAVVF